MRLKSFLVPLLCGLLVGCGPVQHPVNPVPANQTAVVQNENTSSNAANSTAPASDVPANATSATPLDSNPTNAASNPSEDDVPAQSTSTSANTTTRQSSQNHTNASSPAESESATVTWPILSYGRHGSQVLKLNEWLAETGYLPLKVDTNTGKFSWRYAHIPHGLAALWSANKYSLLTRSAVMTCERQHHLAVDGIAGPHVWTALQSDIQHHRINQAGFTFVSVTMSTPERLTAWHDGKVVLTSLANTGIPQSPTVKGTYVVYLQYKSQTMSGVDVFGNHYRDEGVPYVSYFYRGEAIHGFVRSHYGFPQSLGCVELPVKNAASLWPYIHLGTLVQIT